MYTLTNTVNVDLMCLLVFYVLWAINVYMHSCISVSYQC